MEAKIRKVSQNNIIRNDLPTTVICLVCLAIWNLGPSVDTSQLYAARVAIGGGITRTMQESF